MPKLIKTFDYGYVPNSYDVFKAVALLAMVIDHVGFYLMPELSWLRVVGRVAFPVFLFLVGYCDNFRFNRWLLAGAVVVLVSKAVNDFAIFPFYILFSILLWRMMMGFLTKRPHILQDVFMLWVAMLVFYLPTAFLVEYGTLGLMFAVLGWHTRHGRDDRALRLAWLFTALFWTATQSFGFGFDMLQTTVVLAVSLLMMIALMQFRIRDMPLPPGHTSPSPTVLETLVIFSARNTLLLYVLHVVAFQTISRFVLSPGA